MKKPDRQECQQVTKVLPIVGLDVEQSAAVCSCASVWAGGFLFGFLFLSFIFKIKTGQQLPSGRNSISPPSAILNR